VLIVLFTVNYVWLPTAQAPSQFKYDILKDTLTIVLTVLAVGIAATGWLLYIVISKQLKNETVSFARIETRRSSSHLFTRSGFVFWESYERAKGREPQYLEMAISLTERALLYFNEIPDEEAKKRENDRLLCEIKNNLAYYYAVRKSKDDKEVAREYAEYIYERLSKYATEKDNWLDTYRFVNQRYHS